jgi:hypothetical protein
VAVVLVRLVEMLQHLLQVEVVVDQDTPVAM